MKILIVDENEVLRRQLFWAIRKNHDVFEAANRAEGQRLLAENNPDVVLMELLEEGDSDESAGIDMAEKLLRQPSPPVIIIITRSNRKEIAGRLLKSGVFDYFIKPIELTELPLILKRSERQREWKIHQEDSEKRSAGTRTKLVKAPPGVRLEMADVGIIGVDPGIKQIVEQIRRIASTPVSVLITGETGTGKEVFAQAIHRMSDRDGQRFVPLNCAVLSDTLVEDELFGHEKGAFTGAVERRKGRFELANKGTLFLDEIGDLSPPLQSKFLRVLQEKQFERLGGNLPIYTDFRLICATHRELVEMIRVGAFREDLMFRINVISLHLPPLRERRGDIKLMSQTFLREYSEAFGRSEVLIFSREIVRYMYDYNWPGNVRELKHFVERAVALTEGRVIGKELIPATSMSTPQGAGLASSGGNLESLVKRYKRQLVIEALEISGNNKMETAQLLGISRSYLFKLIKQLAIHS